MYKRQGITNIIPSFYKVFDWRQLNPSLFNAIEVERNVMFIILTLIIIVAAFNLISSMMILVSTKTKDIGILRVLGVSRFQLLKIFIINGLFIGLFGTVWGIMNSFTAIGISQNTSLAVVAPGIAEALFATALGLVAAIPSVLFFNKFNTMLDDISNKLDVFSEEIILIISKEIFR